MMFESGRYATAEMPNEREEGAVVLGYRGARKADGFRVIA